MVFFKTYVVGPLSKIYHYTFSRIVLICALMLSLLQEWYSNEACGNELVLNGLLYIHEKIEPPEFSPEVHLIESIQKNSIQSIHFEVASAKGDLHNGGCKQPSYT